MYMWTGSERYEQVLQRLAGASPLLATITKTLSQNDRFLQDDNQLELWSVLFGIVDVTPSLMVLFLF